MDEIDDLTEREHGPAHGLDLSDVRRVIPRLARAGGAFDAAFATVMDERSSWIAGQRDQLRPINVDIYRTERALLNPAGLPRREWFRHVIYAPGLYTGYSAKTMERHVLPSVGNDSGGAPARRIPQAVPDQRHAAVAA